MQPINQPRNQLDSQLDSESRGQPSRQDGLKPWPAPAKLNLSLRVLSRAADNYHELQTLFQILDWGDELLISPNDSGRITRHCNLDTIPFESDIAIKAAMRLQAYCGVEQGAHIDLKKNIPMGAGLGGGSSDAATVLCALNKLWGCGLGTQKLAAIGLELGADVPVFVHGHSAWAEGRGEKLQAVTLGPRYYVLVLPDFEISTAAVFNHSSLKRDSRRVDLALESLQAGQNDCESAALNMHPELKKIMKSLLPWGQAHMTGTGSCVFLQFDSKKTAIRAATEIKNLYNVRAVGGVDRSRLLDRLSA